MINRVWEHEHMNMWEHPQAEVQRVGASTLWSVFIGASFAEVGKVPSVFLNRTGGLVAEWSAGSLQSCAIPQGFLPLWNISFRSVPRICILTPAHTLCHWTPKLFSHDAACAHALVAPRHILAWSISTLHRLCKIHFLVGCDGYQICVRLDYVLPEQLVHVFSQALPKPLFHRQKAQGSRGSDTRPEDAPMPRNSPRVFTPGGYTYPPPKDDPMGQNNKPEGNAPSSSSVGASEKAHASKASSPAPKTMPADATTTSRRPPDPGSWSSPKSAGKGKNIPLLQGTENPMEENPTPKTKALSFNTFSKNFESPCDNGDDTDIFDNQSISIRMP